MSKHRKPSSQREGSTLSRGVQPLEGVLDAVFQTLGLHRHGTSLAVKELLYVHCPPLYRDALRHVRLTHQGERWQVHVWFSHPGVASEFQFVRPQVLATLQRHAPQLGLHIESLEVHVGQHSS
ncbi:MAG: hypothetical protein ACKO34_05480 [Vampirovibrionales bacterium]